MKLREVIFWFHLICGIIVGGFIIVMSVTGAILAFEPQIIDYAERHVQTIRSFAGRQRLSVDEIVSRASATIDHKPSTVVVKSDPRALIFVGFGRDDGRYVNPYDGEVFWADSKIRKWMSDVEAWHRWFGFKEGKGKEIAHHIKGVCTIVFFFMIVSGVYLWWPKNWKWPGIKSIVVFNSQAQGKARDWNWHNVIGFWCAPFLLVATVTGTIMSYRWANDLLFRITGNEPPAVAMDNKPREKISDGLKKASETLQPASLEVLLKQAQAPIVDWVSITLRLAGTGQKQDGKTVTATILEREPANLKPRTQLTLNRFTGEVIKIETFATQNSGRRARIWARYLHTGEALGVIGQSLMAVASAGAIILVWTGFSLAWRRFYKS